MPSFNDLDSWDSHAFQSAKNTTVDKVETLETLRTDIDLLTQTLALMLLRIEYAEKAIRAKKV